MMDLPPEAHALLEKARREHNPTSREAERVRRALYAKLGIAAVLLPAALPTPAVASTSVASTSVASTSVASTSVAATSGSAGTATAALFSLKAGKILLAVVTLSSVASLPLVMRDAPRQPQPSGAVVRSQHPPAEPRAADLPREVTVEPLPVVPTSPSHPVPVVTSLAEPRAPRTQESTRGDLDAVHHRSASASREPSSASREPSSVSREPISIPREPTSGRVRQSSLSSSVPSEPAERNTHGAAASVTPSRASHEVEPVRRQPDVGAMPSTSAPSDRGTSVPSATGAATTSDPLPAGWDRAEERKPSESVQGGQASSTSSSAEPERPQELVLIRSALISLRDGAPMRALSLLGEHAVRYPRGAFASERRGLRVVALCAAGRFDEGRERRKVFLRDEGSSPMAERVRHACQEAGHP